MGDVVQSASVDQPLPEGIGFRVLWQDRWLLVLDKDSGLLSVPGIGSDKADCLASRAARCFRGARIVHRLDRDTSGCIVMALDARTHRELSVQFQERTVGKVYEALVHGIVNGDEGLIDLPLRKDLVNAPLQVVDHVHGRTAQTGWRVLSRDAARDTTRLELLPRTGRSHQLRVHCRELGHTILGDDLYALPAVRAMAPRLCLHARSVGFTHPATGERMLVECQTPF
ncbi:MAG: RluA family pseudouridine synthase [Phycisphaerae bacterium]|nr:RluA family pseudouridine synthase [Phycisphaerae bacterium]